MEFPRKVLDYHFPDADSHIDICKTDFKKYANKIDILTGGFPCQPFSIAGKRKGTDDERYLWGEMLRAIQEIKPRFVIAENVFGITNIDGGLVFQQVCLDLETQGYEVQPFIICAAAKNAPHKRDRCWFVAYSKSEGSSGLPIRKKKTYTVNGIVGSNGDATNTNGIRLRRESNGIRRSRFYGQESSPNNWNNFPTQSPICSGDDGIPRELDGITFSKWRAESIKGYGNAIVPQIAYSLFQIINEL
jgi:DNA (cytosine-5)-methyltransferase 1